MADVAPELAHLSQEELDALEAESHLRPGENASDWASRAAQAVAKAKAASAERAAADEEAHAAGLDGTDVETGGAVAEQGEPAGA